MASKRIQKVRQAMSGTLVPIEIAALTILLPQSMQELKDLQKDPPTSCSAGQ